MTEGITFENTQHNAIRCNNRKISILARAILWSHTINGGADTMWLYAITDYLLVRGGHSRVAAAIIL